MTTSSQIEELVETTTFIDTHEHLIEEDERVGPNPDPGFVPCPDFSQLFRDYFKDDMHVAGLPAEAERRFFMDCDMGPQEKFALIEPYWRKARNTGFGQAVRLTLKGLYGEDDITPANAAAIDERFRARVRPGLYDDIINRRSNIESVQINSLQKIWRGSSQPDLMRQDLSFVELSRCSRFDIDSIVAETGRTINKLDDWLETIDWYFSTYGPRSVAIKNQSAYTRRLDYGLQSKGRAAQAFTRLLGARPVVPSEEAKILHDYLFRYCIEQAQLHGLPVKIHTGYLAGRGNLPVERLRENVADLERLVRDFPDAKFVLMHIGYPYQNEMIALAKQFRNVYVDMCWSWIVDPAASLDFLKRFLMAVPASKLFTFGGDHTAVELIYGHSRMARRGIAQVVADLVETSWMPMGDAGQVIHAIMRGNALEVFPDRRP